MPGDSLTALLTLISGELVINGGNMLFFVTYTNFGLTRYIVFLPKEVTMPFPQKMEGKGGGGGICPKCTILDPPLGSAFCVCSPVPS